MIRGVVVGVPAHDEADTVVDCLTSIDRAAHAVPGVQVVVVLAADRCTDRTVPRASSTILRAARQLVIPGRWGSAGGARAAAIRRGREALSGLTAGSQIWIATTDADTVVPTEWLVRQLEHAAAGADAVAGIIELRDDHHRSPGAERSFRSLYRLEDGVPHEHVHGANLGVRADWYDVVGGFESVGVAEDHRLWHALGRAGAQCLSTIDVRVATSARLHSRAPGGFADTLRAAVALAGKAPA